MPCHRTLPEAEQTMPPETFPVRSHDADTPIEGYFVFSDVTVMLPVGILATVTAAEAFALPPGPVQEIV
jgi:hypothetical protein